MQAFNEFISWKRLFRRWGVFLGLGSTVLVITLISYSNNPNMTSAVLASAVRQATPLILGALCGLLGERAGVINIGIEGQMLMAAFVGFLANVWTGNLFLSVMIGMGVGALLGLFLAFMSVTFKN